MEDIKTEIVAYAKIIDSSLTDGAYLDFVVATVIDRTLAYTNRTQLVDRYVYTKSLYTEEQIAENTNYEGKIYGVECPIPPQLRRVLATVVVGLNTDIQTTDRAVSRVDDNGQSVSFEKDVATSLATASDSELFSGVREILDKFRIVTIVEDNRQLYGSY